MMTVEMQNKNLLDRVLIEIRSRRDEFEEKRHVPRDMIAQLKQLGVYRAHAPRCFGGDASSPSEFLRLIETISEADGSAGWVASFGSAAIYLAALPRETLAQLYANGPDVSFAGGLFPVQPAEKVAGGWRVNGLWKFASGCKGADILGVGIGTGEGGKPLTAVLMPEDVDIVENWEVFGMRGTGSHDLRVKDAFVSDEWTFVRGGVPSIEEPIYQYPSVAYAAQVLAVVNLGVARAALNEVSQVAGNRSSITGAPKMADRAYLRIAVAKAEASLRSARAFFYEATDSAWDSILKGDGVSADQTSMLRLAAVQATRAGASAVQSAYLLSGTAAIYDGHPLQRYLRDAMVVTQHAFLNEGIYDNAGSVFLGVPPMPGYI
ncbi:acyl-CoA dehydrogenase family protein [Alkalihalobacillus sp. MEB130]|uniref:acyl-CoA dehydrogenase family protein n=1 Tax=Alkalihalobacillus sp. MEB130 TaxID=2976704 RepID=UPI0028DDE8FD|nr:acyl-CoA dehydrogenase family protein [Alkalihalobacillus sp. MEB130]MDT8860738.1 acyl-CoA dehydrogenase family protein [Alkalihalobacillus sp. MEB130]